jgi:hypothetical protein
MNAPFEPLLHALAQAHDIDPEETAEWREALLALIGTQGPERARQILDELAIVARQQRTGWQPELNTPYMNTIAVQDQPDFPGDLAMEERLAGHHALECARHGGARQPPMANSAGTSRATPARPTCSKPGFTISSTRAVSSTSR